MKAKFLLGLTAIIGLSACSPHPAAGVWKTDAENQYGINEIILSFEGHADFTTTKWDNASWRCFWSAAAKYEVAMSCKSSTQTDQEEKFSLIVNHSGNAELFHNSSRIAVFQRQDENPSPKK